MSHKKSDDVQGPMLDPSAANKNWVCVCLSHKSSHRHFTLFAAAAHVAYDLCLLQFWVLCQGVLAAAAEASCLWGLSSVAGVCSLAWYTCCRINLGLLVLSRAWQTFAGGHAHSTTPAHQAIRLTSVCLMQVRIGASTVAVIATAGTTAFLPTNVAGFAHLLAFSFWLGSSIWVNVAGLIMFKYALVLWQGIMQTGVSCKHSLTSRISGNRHETVDATRSDLVRYTSWACSPRLQKLTASIGPACWR